MGRPASVPTSPMRVGPGRLVGGGGTTRSLSAPSTSSINVFQSPQLPHCPDHFGYDVPHSLHAYTSLSFAMPDTLEIDTHGVGPVAKDGAHGEPPLNTVCCSLCVCRAADALRTSARAYPSRFRTDSATHAGAQAPLIDTDLESTFHSAQAATCARADIGDPFEADAALALDAACFRPAAGQCLGQRSAPGVSSHRVEGCHHWSRSESRQSVR